MLLYCFYYILLKTVPYRSNPFQIDIASERNGSLNQTVPNCQKKRSGYSSLKDQGLEKNE